MKSFFQFLKTKKGLTHIGIIFGVQLALIAVVFFVLGWFTKHGESIQVPDLKGKTEAEVKQIIEDLGLEYVITDSLFNLEATPGSVRDQSPKPGSTVKSGRTIFLSIFMKQPPMVQINVKEGDHIQIASLRLLNKGIKFNVLYTPNNSMVGVVMKVEYNGKPLAYMEKVRHGETITLTVGQAIDERVPIPNLFGMTYNQAIAHLKSINLSGQGFFDPPASSPADSAMYHVCRQEPKYSAQSLPVNAGFFIDFWLSKEPCTLDTIVNPFSEPTELFPE
ncbi:MAG: PASTA domain-containing protein [Bacteroidota bacterium]|jgi:beta-lactam-binding protein with PASTA domain